VTLLGDLDAFLQEHRHCGELDAAVEDDQVLDDVYVRRGDQPSAGIRRRRGSALDSRQPSSTEVGGALKKASASG